MKYEKFGPLADTKKVNPGKSSFKAPVLRSAPFDREEVQYEQVDRFINSMVGKFTLGLSPMALGMAYADWLGHLVSAPGKQAELVEKALHKWTRITHYAMRAAISPDCEPCIEPLAYDDRFVADAWKKWPFNLMSQSFLLSQQWWHRATTGIRGVSPHHEAVVSFAARQMLDLMSPSNNPLLNPEILNRTLESGGDNLLRGFANWLEDGERQMRKLPPVGAEDYRPGEHVAITEGEVVFRNHVMELIQYAPKTGTVAAEPVLIVPAWIMKYYILDLSPENSLVRYLVERGHTVFMISWKNPGPDQHDLSMRDYIDDGAMAAIDAVSTIVPGRKIHAAGYCLGGTLLSVVAAYMANRGDERLKTVTLFAAQTDFTEAGELMLFIDDAELSFLEDLMSSQGYLETGQMAGTFQLLRSNNLIWSRLIHEYLMGERSEMNDLMAWNSDGTRMPAKMHAEYLRSMFLQNDLAESRYKVHGEAVTIQDIRVPFFVVGTESDHVAPWRSVFKLHHLTDAEITFVLTSGGHNAGIVSEPGHPHRSFHIDVRKADGPYVEPEIWQTRAKLQQGSWWPEWEEWLTAHSGERCAPPSMGASAKGYGAIEAAPGSYVRES